MRCQAREQAQAAAKGKMVRGKAGCCPHEGGQPWGGSAFLALPQGASPTFIPNVSPIHTVPTDQDSDSDSDLSLDEDRSLSIPSSESEENVRLRGRFQRQFKRAAHSERLLTNPANTTPKGKSQGLWQGKG